MRIETEAMVQRSLVKWFRLQYNQHKNHIIRIGNEGVRSIAGHQAAKGQGLVLGASDLFIACPSNGFHGLWLELKRKDYRITPSNKKHCDRQIAFLDDMKKAGYDGYMAFGFDESKAIIEMYMKPARRIQLIN